MLTNPCMSYYVVVTSLCIYSMKFVIELPHFHVHTRTLILVQSRRENKNDGKKLFYRLIYIHLEKFAFYFFRSFNAFASLAVISCWMEIQLAVNGIFSSACDVRSLARSLLVHNHRHDGITSGGGMREDRLKPVLRLVDTTSTPSFHPSTTTSSNLYSCTMNSKSYWLHKHQAITRANPFASTCLRLRIQT